MRINKTILILGITIICLSLFVGCHPQSLSTIEPITQVEEPEAPPPPEPQNFTITLVGDIMIHNTQITSAYRSEIDSYDFSECFKPVKPILKASDLVIGNLETTLAGSKAVYSGYPRFNAPEQLAQNLKDAGFHVITTANNHSLDKGVTGVTETIRHLDEAGLLHTGTFATKEDQQKPLLTEVKGCKIVILAYTYGLNGLVLPKDTTVAINMLDAEQIKNDIKTAQEQEAQLILVALHFGEEYRPTATRAQIQLAQDILEAGAHVIIGHHPHVLEPIVITDEGSSNTKLTTYSLGNFISAQKGLERKSSIILNLHFTLEPEAIEPTLNKASYIPIWTHQYRHNGRLAFRVVPIEPALMSIAANRNDYFTANDSLELDKAWHHVQNALQITDPRISLQELQIPLDELINLEVLPSQ